MNRHAGLQICPYGPASWTGVFGLLNFKSPVSQQGDDNPQQCLWRYCQSKFGTTGGAVACEVLKLAFHAGGGALFTFDLLATLPAGRWPQGPEDYDRQIDDQAMQQAAQMSGKQLQYDQLRIPDRQTLSLGDNQKIDAIELSYRALETLRSGWKQLKPIDYLWLEDFLHRLKSFCIVSRPLMLSFLTLRAARVGRCAAPMRLLHARLGDLKKRCQEHRWMINRLAGESPADKPTPLTNYRTEFKREMKQVSA